MTSTYGDMKARIADELKRSDLTTQIEQQIQSAIAQYDTVSFFFNELAYGTFSTVASQEVYTSAVIPTDIVAIDALTVIYGSTRQIVRRRPWAWLEQWQPGTSTGGPPTDYAYYGQAIRLYPIPTTVMTLNIAYLQAVAAPTADADVGPWMNEAEELIRSSAKRRLFQHVIEDEAALQLMRAAETEALSDLTSQTARLVGTGYVRPTQF